MLTLKADNHLNYNKTLKILQKKKHLKGLQLIPNKDFATGITVIK